MDQITQRFGAGAVRPAVLVDGEYGEVGHRPSEYREAED
jgi:hypothetical protein